MSKPFRLVPSFLALTALLLLPGRAPAGTAVLLRDIADDPQGSAGSSVRQLTPFKDQVAFLAAPHNGFDSVWVSDGTGPGTRVIHSGCQAQDCEGNLEILGAVNGRLVFSVPGEESFGPLRLWSSDGTRGGTVPLTPGDPEVTVGYLSEGAPIVVTSKALYFVACPDAARCGIWGSDGTPAGTRLLKSSAQSLGNRLVLAGDRLYGFTFDGKLFVYDTKTGASAVLIKDWSFPRHLTAAGGKVVFVASSGDLGAELWGSDGTAAGTRALTQFEAADPFDETEWTKEIGGRAYFVANDVLHGFELWRSDGTVQGTQRVTDFGYFQALESLQPANLAEAGGKILFDASDGGLTGTRLWISDGRPESTAPFRSLCQGGSCDLPFAGKPLVQIGGKVFLPGDGGTWSTDGTLAGTRRISPRSCTFSCFDRVFQALAGRLVFTDQDAAHGSELWTSDGTTAGTRRLTDMVEGIPISGAVAAAGGHTFFLGRDRHGEEPWVVDSQGTRLLADIGRSAPGSAADALTPVADRLFFLACAGSDRGLWVSSGVNGTAETTLPVPGTGSACSGSSFSGRHLATAAGRVFFLGPDASFVPQLWSTGGDAPLQLTQFTSSSDFAGLDSAVELNGRLLFPLRSGGQSSLWTSDGTLQGTVRLVVLPDVSTIEGLHAVGNEVYFRGFGLEGADLWRTDGTPGGTRKLAADLYLESDCVRAGTSVLFVAESRDQNGFPEDGLWKTNGTAAGTLPVQVPLGGFFQIPQELTAFQGNAYFFAPEGDRWALWRSDGTTAGTVLVHQFADREEPTQPTRFGLTVFAGNLFFAASDGGDGRELWASDGTAEGTGAGTRMLADLFPGAGSSLPAGFTPAAGKLYFSANDGVHGAELWESDGTAAGTRLAQDIAPEGASFPAGFAVAGNHLFFTADDGLTGREVWSLPLDSVGGNGCLPSSTRLCLNGGRYQVEASWLAPQNTQKTHGTGTAVPLSGDTGAFWFFDPANVEAVVKVLDGEGQNGHVWVFYGALSNVEYTLTVTDTRTGLTRRYFNPLGQFSSVGDTHGFGPLGANSIDREPPVSIAAPSLLPLVSERIGKAAAAPCQASPQRLCLNNNRFAVEVAWKDFQNHTGKGTAVPLTGDTGTFWFFNAANTELIVKALDGRLINGKFWLFYGALSNVEYTLTVTDTQTGIIRTYTNPSGRFASVGDTSAF